MYGFLGVHAVNVGVWILWGSRCERACMGPLGVHAVNASAWVPWGSRCERGCMGPLGVHAVNASAWVPWDSRCEHGCMAPLVFTLWGVVGLCVYVHVCSVLLLLLKITLGFSK